MTKALTQKKVRELLEEGRRNVEESRKPKRPGDYDLSDFGDLRGRKTKRKCSVCKDGTVECLYTRTTNPDYAIYGPGCGSTRYDSSYRCDSCGLCYDFRGMKKVEEE
jgi:hypothetical protein